MLLGLVLLLAVVAVASSGNVPTGSNATRRPWHEVADTVVSLILIVVLAGGVGIFYVYYLQRSNEYRERRSGRAAGGTRRSLMTFLGILLFAIGASILVALRSHRHQTKGFGLAGSGTDGQTTGTGGYTPHFATVPVTVIVVAGGIAAIAAYLSFRASRGSRLPLGELEPSLALTLADVLGETLDDLRREPDPRVAVIAAYARLERTLTAFGVPRRKSDAPEEYLQRILIDLEVGAQHASRLTQLFEHAKFSDHDVGPEMKAEAIDLLETIRADLQAAEASRRARPPLSSTVGQPA